MRYLFESSFLPPTGDGTQGARPSYNNSGYYDVIFPQAKSQAKPIVTRATIRGLYGKVDTHGFAIVPKQDRLAEIVADTEETHEAIYIVKECFEEMADYYKQLDLRGKLNINNFKRDRTCQVMEESNALLCNLPGVHDKRFYFLK